jgi:hypothetical protein
MPTAAGTPTGRLFIACPYRHPKNQGKIRLQQEQAESLKRLFIFSPSSL